MEWVRMSERVLKRVEVLSQIVQQRMTVRSAADVLDLSPRQVHRLLKAFAAEDPAAIRHHARGQASNNRIDPAIRDYTLTLVRERYADSGPTLAALAAGRFRKPRSERRIVIQSS